MATQYKKIYQRQDTRSELDSIIREQFLAFDETNDYILYSKDGQSFIEFYNKSQIDTISATLNSYNTSAAFIYTGVSQPTLAEFTNNGDGTATFPEVRVRLCSASDFTANIKEYTIPSTTLSFANNSEGYVCVNYNGGNPIYYVEYVRTNINCSNIIQLYTVWRENLELHSVGMDSLGLGLANKIQKYVCMTSPYKKDINGGLSLSETSIPNPRTIQITPAIIYAGVVPVDVGAFDSAIDRLTLYYHNAGVWNSTDNLVYNNTQYDNGTSLQTLGSNKFGVRWFYRSIGDIKQTFYVLGSGQYSSIIEAKSEAQRSDLPLVVRNHCVLVGRIIVQLNASSGTVERVADTTFETSLVQSHSDLSNLQGGVGGEYYHLTLPQLNSLSALSIPKLPLSGGTLTGQLKGTTISASGNISASSFKKIGGTSAQFLKADGSIDTNTYLSSNLFNEYLQEPTGFIRKEDSVISMNASTMTFNISAVSTSYDILYRGTKITKTSDSITLDIDQGLWYVYFTSAGTLTASKTPWDFSEVIPVSLVYQDSLGGVIIVGEERHGAIMDHATHTYLHNNFGTRYTSGFVASYTLNSDTSAGFGLTEGKISDEDLVLSISQGASGNYFTQQINYPGIFPTYCKIGDDSTGATGLWRIISRTNLPYYGWTNQINYNYYVGGTWGQTTASNNNYVAFYIFATNNKNEPIISIQGQRQDISLDAAKNNNTPASLILTDFPTKEAKLLYRIILKTSTTYTGNPYRVRIEDVTDYRSLDINITNVGGTGTVTYVALSANPMFTITGSPITNAGTFTIDLSAQPAKNFLVSPTATSGIPSFRTITSADIPTLPYVNLSGGTNLGFSGNVSAANYNLSGSIVFKTPTSSFASFGATSSDILIRNLSADGSIIDYPLIIEKFGTEKISLGTSGKIRSIEMGGPVTIQNLSAAGFVRTNASGLLTSNPLVAGDIPSLSYLPLSGGTLTGQLKGTSISASGNISANSFVKTGGTSNQFLKADGSSDNNNYNYTLFTSAYALSAIAGGTSRQVLNYTLPAGILNTRSIKVSFKYLVSNAGTHTAYISSEIGSNAGTDSTFSLGSDGNLNGTVTLQYDALVSGSSGKICQMASIVGKAGNQIVISNQDYIGTEFPSTINLNNSQTISISLVDNSGSSLIYVYQPVIEVI